MTGEFSKVSFLESFNKNCVKRFKDRFITSHVLKPNSVLKMKKQPYGIDHLQGERGKK